MAFALLPLAAWVSVGLQIGGWLLARAARRGRSFVRHHPDSADWLLDLGLTGPDDFLSLESVIVSGHPGRRVLRLILGQGDEARVAYLKVEQKVRMVDRLRNCLAGHGLASRSLREARMLERLHEQGLPAPRWLAVGEDAGRAFLLVEGAGDSAPLARALQGRSPRQRRRLASAVGEALARLHAAGFAHRDLYSKHVLVAPGGAVTLLDWQRATRQPQVSRLARVRDLAALHATLPESLASPRERLVLLRAYLRSSKEDSQPSLRAVLRESGRLLSRRHVREKRQAHDAAQEWLRLDGQALCVTPALAQMYPDDQGAWLALDRQPTPRDERPLRRWVSLPTGGLALLVRRRSRSRPWLGRTELDGQQREAMLLWRLERHGVAAPRVLAVGRRCRGAEADSFLLVEPLARTARLVNWLRRQPEARRAEVLRRVGVLVARLHEGCCYLGEAGLRALAVRVEGTGFEPVLESAEGVAPLRRPDARCAKGDLAGLRRMLLGAGCSPADWRCCEEGYSPARDYPEGSSLWGRLRRGWRRVRQSADWPSFAGEDWPERIMDWPVTDRFFAKQGRSTGRLVLDGPAGRLVVYLKRHYHLSPLRRLAALLWPGGDWSPAMQEYNRLQWARRQGVPVPRPVAAAEFIGPGLRLRSVLAVEELTGMLPLNEAVPLAARTLAPEDFRRWKRGLVRELARLVRLLHDRRHFHKDLYLCHFFIHQDDTARVPDEWREHVRLIDLHRLAHHPRTWPLWAVKDLAQLLYSSDVPGVTARDRLRFWRDYRGPGRGGRLWHWLRLAVRFKWQRYERHNRKRPAQA